MQGVIHGLDPDHAQTGTISVTSVSRPGRRFMIR